MSISIVQNGNRRELRGRVLGSIVALSTLLAGLPVGLQQVNAQSSPAQTAPAVESVESTPTEQLGTEGAVQPVAASTAAPSTGPVELSDFDPAIDFVMEEQGLNRSQAEAYMDRERSFSSLASQFADVPGYAGSWVVRETQEFFLAASSREIAESMRTAVSALPLNVDVLDAEYSYNELLELGEELRAATQALPIFADVRALTSIEPSTNSLVLWIHSPEEFSQAQRPNATDEGDTVSTVLAESELLERFPVSDVQYSGLDDLPREVNCAAGPFCDPPLTAGVQTGHHNSSGTYLSRCTSGFMVEGNNNNRDYMLTAGHCLLNNAGPDVVRTRFASGSNHIIGNEATAYDNDAVDAGLVYITNPVGWKVSVGSLSAIYQPDGNIGRTAIKNWGASPMNSTRCITTANSDMTECGVVWRLGYSSQDLGSVDICGVIPGDSGSPVYNLTTAYGIIISIGGGPWDTHCKANFQGMSRILSELKVSLNTHN